MKKIQTILFLVLAMVSASVSAKTLVVYYSYTNKSHEIVQTLISQIEADTMRIYPEDKTQQYEANNYAIGTQLLNAINAAPDDPDSYPAIDPVRITDLSSYQNIIIVTPLWWSQMAAIMQTYLFHYGPMMAGKHVGLIVSSHSSGISGVVANAQRLVPDAVWMGEALWIKASNHANRATLIQNWLTAIDYASLAAKTAGDVNGNGEVNMDDLAALINFLLTDDANLIYFDNAAICDDLNSETVEMDDLTALINFLLTDNWPNR